MSIVDKIIEKLCLKEKAIYFFSRKMIILFRNQFGFRKNNSTVVHALAQITVMISIN